MAEEIDIGDPQCLKWINVKILDGLASMTSEPHMYTAAVSLVRDPVVFFAALANCVSLLIYYNYFLITI